MNIFGLDPVLYFGEFRYSPGGTYGPKLQPHLHLHYFYTGGAVITVGERAFSVARGEAILVPQGTRNHYQFSTQETTRLGQCSLVDPRIGKSTAEALRRTPAVVPFTPAMRKLAEMGYGLRNATMPAELRVRAHLGMALISSFLAASNFLREEKCPLPEAVGRVKTLVDTRYAEPLTLDDLAQAASLTKAHLIRLFTRHLGQSPIEYLWQVRVTQGIELVRTSGLRLSEIASQTGFKSIFHFSRRVRAACGVPPSEIRKRQGLA